MISQWLWRIFTLHMIACPFVKRSLGLFLTMGCNKFLIWVLCHVSCLQVAWRKIIKLLFHYIALIRAPHQQSYDPRGWTLSFIRVINFQCLIILDLTLHILRYRHYLCQVCSTFFTHHWAFTNNSPSLIIIWNCQWMVTKLLPTRQISYLQYRWQSLMGNSHKSVSSDQA